MDGTAEQPGVFAPNEAQIRAIEHTGRPLVVLAGPGTGKTYVITRRIAHLIERGADPESILGVTFTVKAAEQMRDRVAGTVGAGLAQRAVLCTFHAFGRQMLTRFGDLLGLPSDLVILDSAQRRRLLRRLIIEHGLFPDRRALGRENVIEEAAHYIEKCRQCARFPEDALRYAALWQERAGENSSGLEGDDLLAERARAAQFAEFARLYALYDELRLARGFIGFDDFITLPIRLMREKQSVGPIIRSEIGHIVVDEFQDVNAAQIELLRLLSPPSQHRDLCVVGDDDQAIYGFRGSDPRAFSRFAEIWPDHERVTLEINYRSAPVIIETANSIISRAADRFEPDKIARPNPERVDVKSPSLEGVIVNKDSELGKAIAAMIHADLAGHSDRRYRDYCVIARIHTNADEMALALELAGIPVDRRRKPSPLDDLGVQDVLAWIEMLLDPMRTHATQRLLIRPPCLVPPETVQIWNREFRIASRERSDLSFIDWLQSAHGDDHRVEMLVTLYRSFRHVVMVERADKVIETIIRQSGVVASEHLDGRRAAQRVTNLVNMIRYARGRVEFLDEPRDLASFWSYYQELDASERDFSSPQLDRIDADDESGDRPDAVTIISGHAAKGLEFDTVFVARVRPGWGFPNTRASDSDPIELPAEFLDLSIVDRIDEERRIFYVAATRAERRLVLLAEKRAGSKSSSTDFYNELRDDSSITELQEVHADHWLAQVDQQEHEPIDSELGAGASGETQEVLLRCEMVRARHLVYAALHELDIAASSTEKQDAAMVRLQTAGRMIGAVAHLRETGRLPATLELPEAEIDRLEAIRKQIAGGTANQPILKPQRPPLHLSYTKIQDYATCPRCFYVKHILRLDEEKTPGLALGDLVHRALEQFARNWQAAEADGKVRPTLDDLIRIGRQLHARERQAWDEDDPDFLDQLDALLTRGFEMLSDEPNILEVERTVNFPFRFGEHTHQFTAKIDRIDQLNDGRFRIVDYKTGEAFKKLLEPPKSDPQLAIYAMALQALQESEETPDGVAEYWILSTGQAGMIDLGELKLDKVRNEIEKVITGLLEGDFSRNSRTCRGLCSILPDWVV